MTPPSHELKRAIEATEPYLESAVMPWETLSQAAKNYCKLLEDTDLAELNEALRWWDEFRMDEGFPSGSPLLPIAAAARTLRDALGGNT